MKTTNRTNTDTTYPVGLTVREIEQRAWIEGDLHTAALLAASQVPHAADTHTGGPRFELAVRGQLPLEMH